MIVTAVLFAQVMWERLPRFARDTLGFAAGVAFAAGGIVAYGSLPR